MRRLGIASFCLAAVALSSTASAHVRFTDPVPRYPNPTGFDNGMNIKQGPCGRTNDSRTTDPARINEFTAGETITVQFNETIDHPGFYRISFDDDGQDAFEPPPLSRDDIVSAPTSVILKDNIEDKNGGSYAVEVTLPNVNCDNCTLQLIQVMVDDDTWPRSEIYYTCADITLTGATNGGGGMGGGGAGGAASGGAGAGGASAGSGGVAGASGGGGAAAGAGGTPGSGGSAGAANTSGTGGTSAGGNSTGGTAPSATGGTSSATGGTGGGTAGRGGTPGTAGSTGGAPPTAGSGAAPSAPAAEDEGGCSISSVGTHGGSAAVIATLGAALLAFGVRRKRR